MRKKLWMLLLVVSLAAVLLCVTVCAADVSDLEYEITDGEVIITDCNEDASGKLTIPSTIEGKPVTSIGDYAFHNCSSLTSITIPEGVTSIRGLAFYQCSSLTDVTIPDSVTSIGRGAFFDCSSLTHVMIPNSVTSIGDEAFHNCSSLENISIPDSVTDAGGGMFCGCTKLVTVRLSSSMTELNTIIWHLDCFGFFTGCSSLKSVTIPIGITYIEKVTFSGCTSLSQINVSTGNNMYSSKDGVLYNKAQTELICYPAEKNDASFTIPASVTGIGDYAFYGCTGLTSVTIPNSVTSIGDYAFYGCTGLTNVTIPASVTSIGSWTFSDCGNLKSVTIPNSVTSISDYAFYGCTGLTSVTIPASVASIGSGAFSGCTGLTSVTIPNSVTSIGWDAFHGCKSLTSATIGDGVTSIGQAAFFDCSSLKSVTIPDSVTAIEDDAFFDCSSLTSVTIGNGVTSIGWNAFLGCSSLTSVTIGYNVINIGDSAFYGCSNLTDVYYTGTQNQWNAIKIENEYGGNDPLKSATIHYNYVAAAIKTQPKAATITGSSTATFKVTATGDGLKYQWQYLKPNGSWTNCTSKTTGYNTATLKVQGVTCSTNRDGYQYRCVVTDSNGNKVTSKAATLRVTAITTQPTSATIAGGGTATFKVAATGDGLTYQWQFKTTSGEWKNCTSATQGYNTATLKVQGVTGSTNRNGYQYRCKVTDSAGNTVTSSAATLTVKVLKITTQPTAASVKTTAYATFTVKATGDGLKYQWQFKTTSGEWKNCTSATKGYNTATLKVQGVTGTTNRDGYQYRCVITDSSGAKVTSNAVKLSVLAVTTQPKATSVSKTGTATFTVKATGSNLTYQWQYKTPNGSWKNCSSATTGYNTATLKVQGVSGSTNRNGYQYRCKITCGTKTVTTNAVTLTVK